MSTDILYRVWVERIEGELIVSEVSSSSNVSPKPRGRELTRASAREWKRFSRFDVNAIRDFVLRQCKGYDGGCLRETTRLDAPTGWRRWRTRFLRAGGPDVGEYPGSVTWNDAPAGVFRDPEQVLVIKKGDLLDETLVRRVIEEGVRLQIVRLPKGQVFNPSQTVSDGALGFVCSDGALCYYRKNHRRSGWQLELASYDIYALQGATVHCRRTGRIPLTPTRLSNAAAGSTDNVDLSKPRFLTAADWIVVDVRNSNVLCGETHWVEMNSPDAILAEQWRATPCAFTETQAAEAAGFLNRDAKQVIYRARPASSVFPGLSPVVTSTPLSADVPLSRETNTPSVCFNLFAQLELPFAAAC